ncbi:MAG TPA: VCBS repeat-containing protein [Verrucomicrobiae bacterium]
MRFLQCPEIAIAFSLVAAEPAGAAALEFQRQTIHVPAASGAWRGWQMSCLADIDNNGLADLLAVGPAENKLWIYRQQASGFSLSPDQVIELPAQTAWIALCDVEAHPGVELVLSTATGLAYLRQSRGVFESQPRALVHVTQIFTNHTPPRLVSLDTQANGTTPSLPVISASHAVLYQRDGAGGWSPGPPLALQEKQTQWFIERDGWLVGTAHSRSLAIRRSFLVPAVEDPEKKAEEKAVEKILVENESPERVNDVDIDGDGREDLVLWRLAGDLEAKTDILVFLRGSNNRLPEQPTQVLHCRGFPVEVGHRPKLGPVSQRISPVCALAGDGRCELVLATLKTAVSSASGVADMVLSGSVEFALTIRTFNQGFFSRSPDASIPLTTMVPVELAMSELLLIDGDFNGDGRTDALVRRSSTQWNVILSSARDWFAPKPALSLEVPNDGNFLIRDFNADGLADLVVQAWDEPTLFIFLSQPQPGKRGQRDNRAK